MFPRDQVMVNEGEEEKKGSARNEATGRQMKGDRRDGPAQLAEQASRPV